VRALAPPDPEAWRRRADWFWRAHDANAGPAPRAGDARAELLVGELEIAFCAGAWAAAVLLAWALVEARERAREAVDDAPPRPDVDWLRERRNALAHAGAGDPPDEATLESWAQGAVRTAFAALGAGAWR
jgi:hypothetical protein